jgi:hypothetical protein
MKLKPKKIIQINIRKLNHLIIYNWLANKLLVIIPYNSAFSLGAFSTC